MEHDTVPEPPLLDEAVTLPADGEPRAPRPIDVRAWQTLEGSPIPTFVLDRHHLITHWNHACERVTGFAAARMIGTRNQGLAFYGEARPVMADLVLDRVPPEALAACYGGASRPSAFIPGAYEAESFFPAMGESGTWLFFTAALLHDCDGNVVGAMETLQDISPRKRAEAELERYRHQLEELVQRRTGQIRAVNARLREEIDHRRDAEAALRAAHQELAHKAAVLEAANEELSQYAYVVSHDLKAPLRAIRNYSDFLREDLGDALGPEQQLYLDGLRRALRQSEDLVVDLLECSRIGRTQVLTEPVPCGGFLRELLASLDLPGDVVIALQDDWPVVLADRTLLHQIFQNLVTNAVKFNRSSPRRVAFGWRTEGVGRCEISVCDNGIGIDPRYHDQIFRMFQRLHTSKEFDGTGIGLAIVKKAAARLCGAVRVESEPGRGTTFYVSLPLAGEVPP